MTTTSMSARSTDRIATYGTIAGVASLALGPLLALAYFATPGGAEELAIGTVSAWAHPAARLARPLLTFAEPQQVYNAYNLALALLFPAVVLTAVATRRTRTPIAGRGERMGWRAAVAGYALFGTAALVVAIALFGGEAADPAVEIAFLAGMLPGMLLTAIGSTILGVALLRSGYRPRATAVLLTASVPLLVIGSDVLGHNGLGIVPLVAAWGLAASHLREQPAVATSAASLAATGD